MKKTKIVTHATLGRGVTIPCPVTGRCVRVLDNGKLTRFVEVLFEGETEPRRILETYLSFSTWKWNFPSLQVRTAYQTLSGFQEQNAVTSQSHLLTGRGSGLGKVVNE